ncbi:MAG: UDP-N-acetylglucosamine pyrophosphorylase [Clostridia bacterium]|nr:UDP-N-acetylglucosamine pyrophosphorylase [Clostridia bacterium]
MQGFEEQLRVTALYRYPEHSIAYDYLASFTYPWEALDGLADFIRGLGATLSPDEYDHPADDVWIAKTAKVAPTAYLGGPLIVCDGAEVRHCAFIRGSAIVGAGAVVGNSTELKNCILFDRVQVPHFNYVGDAVLGYRSHMGAGAVTSNVKSDKTPVVIRCETEAMPTGRKKCGAMLGDFVEVGCNSVLNPGTVIGSNSTVYPLSSVRGFVPERHIFKSREEIILKRED